MNSGKKLWYKKTGGVIFLIMIGIILAGLVGFGGLLAYYSWQIKFGDAEALADAFGRDSSNGSPTSAKISQETLNRFIRPHNAVFGGLDSPVTIIAFLDFTCPFSQATYATFKKVMQNFESSIRVVVKLIPLASRNAQALDAAMAAQCANEQNRFWDYYDLLFQNKKFDKESLLAFAGEIGDLNQNRFKQCLNTKKFTKELEQDLKDAAVLVVRGTPTYFINTAIVEGTLNEEKWSEAILAALQTNVKE